MCLAAETAWDVQARAWAAWEGVLERGFRKVTETMLSLADIQSDDRVLDAACGTGVLAAEARRTTRHVVGADLSERMLAHCRSRTDTVEWLHADLDDAVGEGPWDVILCRFGAFFAPDPAAWLVRAKKALRPGGRIVLGVWGPPDAVPMIAGPNHVAVDLFGADPDIVPAPLAVPPDVWPRWMHSAGFENIRSDLAQVSMPFGDGFADFATDMTGLRDADALKYRDAISKSCPLPSGRMDNEAWVVSGTA